VLIVTAMSTKRAAVHVRAPGVQPGDPVSAVRRQWPLGVIPCCGRFFAYTAIRPEFQDDPRNRDCDVRAL
jgi:hypothetical protein